MEPTLTPLPQSLQAPPLKLSSLNKDKDKDSSNDDIQPEDYFAAPITLDGCRCPHLEAYLPTFLLGSGFSSSSNQQKDPHTHNHRYLSISDLHFASLYPDITGSEHEQHPLEKKDVSFKSEDDKHKNEKKVAPTSSNLEKDNSNIPPHLRKHAFGEEEYKNNAIAIGALSEFYYPLYPGYHLERMETQKQLEALSKTMVQSQMEEATQNQTTPLVKEVPIPPGPTTVTLKKEESAHVPKSETLSPLKPTISSINVQGNDGTLSKDTSMPEKTEMNSSTVSSSFPIEAQNISPPDVTASQATEPNPSSSTFSSEYDRFHKICSRIRKQRKNLLAKARDVDATTAAASSQKKKKTSKKRNRAEDSTSLKDSTKLGSPYTSPTKGTRNTFNDDGIFLHSEEQREKDTLLAASKVEEWLEVIRQTRLDYWAQEKNSGPRFRQVENEVSVWSGLCQYPNSSAVPVSCQPCNRKSQNKKKWKATPKGDEVMICLECSFRGCGPDLKGSSSSQHLMQHFLHSGHFLGMTCGPRGEIFCMKCGDFVYHNVLDREKERVDIQVNLGHLGWERRGITKRSFGFGNNFLDDFIVLPHGVMEDKDVEDNMSSTKLVEPCGPQHKKEENEDVAPIVRKHIPRDKGMVLWKGFRALYPNDVTNELVLAARKSLHRWRVYQGRFNDGTSTSWSPFSLNFALHQQRRRNNGNNGLEIDRPVGLYNLGNTCYMSCILQCLMSLAPLQKYFLHQVRHDHNVCQLLRSTMPERTNLEKNVESEKNTVKSNGSLSFCLACEIDKLFLSYYGSTIGMDVIKAIKEDSSTTSSSTIELSSGRNTNDEKGIPVAPSDFLQASWQCTGMSHLAGHEQRDAHEFLQAFLDIMGKHCVKYDQSVREMREEGRGNKCHYGCKTKTDEGTA